VNRTKKHQYLTAFVKQCYDMGITNDDVMLDMLKIALAPPPEPALDKTIEDAEEISRDKGKQPWQTASTKVIERDAYGLPGDPNRTNVGTTDQYAI